MRAGASLPTYCHAWILCIAVLLSAPAYANQYKMREGTIIPPNCGPGKWPDVCEYNGQLTWAGNGLPVPAGVTTYMFADKGHIPLGPCHWPGLRIKNNPD